MTYELKSMNTEAEKIRSLQEDIPHEFQRQYASTILELEKLNFDLSGYLKGVQLYSNDIAGAIPEQGLGNFFEPDYIKKKFYLVAKEVTEKNLGTCLVKNERAIDLCSQLLTLLLHLKGFATEAEVSSFELKALTDSLHDTRKMVEPDNVGIFENQVEIHVNHVQSSLSHLGNLGAFSESIEA